MTEADQDGDKSRLYLALSQVPFGRLCSYGQLAEQAGFPGRARWVGRCLSQLPRDSSLPWFRVVNASGKISFAANTPAHRRQLKKLIDEGSAEASGRLLWRQRRWPEESG